MSGQWDWKTQTAEDCNSWGYLGLLHSLLNYVLNQKNCGSREIERDIFQSLVHSSVECNDGCWTRPVPITSNQELLLSLSNHFGDKSPNTQGIFRCFHQIIIWEQPGHKRAPKWDSEVADSGFAGNALMLALAISVCMWPFQLLSPARQFQDRLLMVRQKVFNR